MPGLTVIAHTHTPTNTRLGCVLNPSQAAVRLRAGDLALGRLDVLRSLDGIERGLWALDLLERRGVRVLNTSATLSLSHDKLATAGVLAAAGIPHPLTAPVSAWHEACPFATPVVLKPRFGSWGRDVTLCASAADLADALEVARARLWFNAAGGIVQEFVPPVGYDLRVIVAAGQVVGAVSRHAADGEWRTNIAHGARRVPAEPPPDARRLALAAAAAVGGDLVGVDLLPLPGDGWIVIEVNGAVEFTEEYSLEDSVYDAVACALAGERAPSLVALTPA